MGVGARPRSAAGNSHTVHFYSDDRCLGAVVARFVRQGLATGEPAIVIATPGHRDVILEDLAAHHVDVERETRAGRLVTCDAEDLLTAFMHADRPDRSAFGSAVSGLTKTLSRRRAGAGRAYGELVDVLWQRGLKRAAIELESFWSNVIRAQHLALLCGYAMPAFYQEPDALEEVCRQHTDVRMSIRLLSPTG